MKFCQSMTLLKKMLSRNIILVFIFLVLSGGSNTFSGSLNTKFENLINKQIVFKVDGSCDYFALVPYEVMLLRQKKIAESKIIINPSLEIYHQGVFSINKMAAYLKNNNPNINDTVSLNIAELYIEESDKEGINHDVAFSQMCLETGFLKFGGDVIADQNNFCGLGVTGGGVKGLSFDDARSGIRAHIQHLKAYASTDDLNMEVIDQRFHYVKRGSAPKVDDLTGKWATDINYGHKISNIISRIENYNNF